MCVVNAGGVVVQFVGWTGELSWKFHYAAGCYFPSLCGHTDRWNEGTISVEDLVQRGLEVCSCGSTVQGMGCFSEFLEFLIRGGRSEEEEDDEDTDERGSREPISVARHGEQQPHAAISQEQKWFAVLCSFCIATAHPLFPPTTWFCGVFSFACAIFGWTFWGGTAARKSFRLARDPAVFFCRLLWVVQ